MAVCVVVMEVMSRVGVEFCVVVSKAATNIDDWVVFEAGGLVMYLKVRLQALVLWTSSP